MNKFHLVMVGDLLNNARRKMMDNRYDAAARIYRALELYGQVLFEETTGRRNDRVDSILAHGIKPVSEKAVASIFQTVSEFVKFKDFYDFPCLP